MNFTNLRALQAPLSERIAFEELLRSLRKSTNHALRTGKHDNAIIHTSTNKKSSLLNHNGTKADLAPPLPPKKKLNQVRLQLLYE